ncbi:MAG: protein kinase [Candidatus Coatesbacteria bacterium]|nr:protein kinase [Candidatus Coatesbacteria bacterium]
MVENGAQGQSGPNSWECLACGTRNTAETRSCNTCGAPAIIPLEPIQTLDPEELLARFGPSGSRLIGNRYRLVAAVGSGSTGSVFKALDVNLDRLVAIKVLSTTSADGMDVNTRFLRLQIEGQTLGRLRHGGLVTVFDMGNEEGVLYVVMEFVKGRPLKSFLAPGKPIPVQDAVSIMIQVCDALQHVHKHGAVHRDLKPSNIMLLEHDRVKITDFGLAKAAYGSRVSEAGLVVGTPYYMSPEQLQAKEVDQRSDVFSAGIVLYEMVTGRKPFEGENLKDVVKAILSGRFIKPRQWNMLIPAEIEAAIEKALTKNRDLRYFSISEFGNDLKSWQGLRQFALTDEAELSFSKPVRKLKGPYQRQRKLRRSVAAFLLVVAALVTSVAFLLIYVNSDKRALEEAAIAILEDFNMHRFDRVYESLSDDFKWRYSVKDFLDLPYLGFPKTGSPEEMICVVEKIVFLEKAMTANVIVSVRYANAVTAQRYTMLWVKEDGRWRFRNPDYDNFREMFGSSAR